MLISQEEVIHEISKKINIELALGNAWNLSTYEK